jgi:calcineurin-like phosphoesterase family protein
LEATLCYKGVLRKINVNAKQLLDKFMVDVNTVIKPEFVVVLGDLIEHENEEKDLKHLAYIYDKLQELHCPVHYVAGNHDLIYLSEEQLEKALHLESLYYSFDTEKYHNIILFSQAVKGVSSISEEQTQRLQYELKKTDKKCLIFLHH